MLDESNFNWLNYFFDYEDIPGFQLKATIDNFIINNIKYGYDKFNIAINSDDKWWLILEDNNTFIFKLGNEAQKILDITFRKKYGIKFEEDDVIKMFIAIFAGRELIFKKEVNLGDNEIRGSLLNPIIYNRKNDREFDPKKCHLTHVDNKVHVTSEIVRNYIGSFFKN